MRCWKMMTTIEVNLELIMVIVLLIATLFIGYFFCFYPCTREYSWKKVENFSCPHCNSTDISIRGDHYYCYQCKAKLKRKAK